MKIIVTEDHNYRLKPAVTMAFKASPDPITVKKSIGEALIAAGVAMLPTNPVNHGDTDG